jgi:hypothetical protein
MGPKPDTHQKTCAQALPTNNSTQRHGGNRGLNTQQLMREMKTRCVGKQDQTNGKLKVDRRMPPEQGEEPTSVEVVTG